MSADGDREGQALSLRLMRESHGVDRIYTTYYNRTCGFPLYANEEGGLADMSVSEKFSANDDEIFPVDFLADPEVVRTFVEGERLNYGYLFNPVFATETSLIDPLPHQLIAVYDYMLKQPRLRFLLADDAGAGKTIMTGLYVREMLARRLISRVLVVPPAGLVGNWEYEMRGLFNLPFHVVTGGDARGGILFGGRRAIW